MEDQETGYGELHLHLDGAITPRIAKKLAALQGIELPYEGEQLNNALSVGEDCQSLNEFLQCFNSYTNCWIKEKGWLYLRMTKDENIGDERSRTAFFVSVFV